MNNEEGTKNDLSAILNPIGIKIVGSKTEWFAR